MAEFHELKGGALSKNKEETENTGGDNTEKMREYHRKTV